MMKKDGNCTCPVLLPVTVPFSAACAGVLGMDGLRGSKRQGHVVAQDICLHHGQTSDVVPVV